MLLTAVTMVPEIAIGWRPGSMALLADGWQIGCQPGALLLLGIGLALAAESVLRRWTPVGVTCDSPLDQISHVTGEVHPG